MENGWPRRHFGIRDANTDALVGNVEANLRSAGLRPVQVNISYSVFPTWRERGIARRAVLLVCEWLRTDHLYVSAVVRVAPENVHSHKVPKDAGFAEAGVDDSSSGSPLVQYGQNPR